MFNPVTTYGYLLPNVYLSVADIENLDLLACSCHMAKFILKIKTSFEAYKRYIYVHLI